MKTLAEKFAAACNSASPYGNALYFYSDQESVYFGPAAAVDFLIDQYGWFPAGCAAQKCQGELYVCDHYAVDIGSWPDLTPWLTHNNATLWEITEGEDEAAQAEAKDEGLQRYPKKIRRKVKKKHTRLLVKAIARKIAKGWIEGGRHE